MVCDKGTAAGTDPSVSLRARRCDRLPHEKRPFAMRAQRLLSADWGGRTALASVLVETSGSKGDRVEQIIDHGMGARRRQRQAAQTFLY